MSLRLHLVCSYGKTPCHEDVWRSEVIAPPTVRFTSGEIDTGNHWMGDWVGPRAGLDAVVRGKDSSP